MSQAEREDSQRFRAATASQPNGLFSPLLPFHAFGPAARRILSSTWQRSTAPADLARNRPLSGPRRVRPGPGRRLPAARGTAPGDGIPGRRPEDPPLGTGARSFPAVSGERRRPRHGGRSLSPGLSPVSTSPESSKLTSTKGGFEERRQERNLCLNTREG